MKKVIVIGCSGSGKSYFSRKLSEQTGIERYHLDMIWWKEDGTNIERNEFDEKLGEILAKDAWIIDGNYQRTMERRINACDTVIFFDIPLEECIDGIRARKGKPRPDMMWQAAPEEDDAEFMEFVRNYNINNRPQVLELLKMYSRKNIVVFESRCEADDFLSQLK